MSKYVCISACVCLCVNYFCLVEPGAEAAHEGEPTGDEEEEEEVLVPEVDHMADVVCFFRTCSCLVNICFMCYYTSGSFCKSSQIQHRYIC